MAILIEVFVIPSCSCRQIRSQKPRRRPCLLVCSNPILHSFACMSYANIVTGKRRTASEPTSSPIAPRTKSKSTLLWLLRYLKRYLSLRHRAGFQEQNLAANTSVRVDQEQVLAENRRLIHIVTQYFAANKNKGHLVQDKKTRDVFIVTADGKEFSFPVMIRKSCASLTLRRFQADQNVCRQRRPQRIPRS